MTPNEFRTRILGLFGPVQTEAKAAAALRSDRRTIYRWQAGERPVPGPVIDAIERREECEMLRTALLQIANGNGIYGLQAHAYKTIAREALEFIRFGETKPAE